MFGNLDFFCTFAHRDKNNNNNNNNGGNKLWQQQRQQLSSNNVKQSHLRTFPCSVSAYLPYILVMALELIKCSIGAKIYTFVCYKATDIKNKLKSSNHLVVWKKIHTFAHGFQYNINLKQRQSWQLQIFG